MLCDLYPKQYITVYLVDHPDTSIFVDFEDVIGRPMDSGRSEIFFRPVTLKFCATYHPAQMAKQPRTSEGITATPNSEPGKELNDPTLRVGRYAIHT